MDETIAQTSRQPSPEFADTAPGNDGGISPEAGRPSVVAVLLASSGGEAALQRFFAAMPADNGVAFVVVSELETPGKHGLEQALVLHNDLPVCEVVGRQCLESGHIYCAPAGRGLTLAQGGLCLAEEEGAAPRPQGLLAALATDLGERVVCIVLSGTGGQGALALEEIKARGGMAIVQDPASAAFAQMPAIARDTGLADHVLPPERMPEALLAYARGLSKSDAASVDYRAVRDDLQKIVAVLRQHTGVDFGHYRQRMLLRRVHRRMLIDGVERVSEYVDRLCRFPEELERLRKDLLISVTSFLRDPEMFEILENHVVPGLFDRGGQGPVRVWVPACATGEEAYSVAMLLLERAAAIESRRPIQVFATDVDELALLSARAGRYDAALMEHVSQERLQRFFVQAPDGQWEVGKALRAAVLFARQDLLDDAPFSKVDLISCRNLLIYLDAETQNGLLQTFHFALNRGGYLVLGPAESTGDHDDVFDALSRKWRIFRHAKSPAAPSARTVTKPAEPASVPVPRRPDPDSPTELARSMLLESYAPAAVVIDAGCDILYYSGSTQRYLRQPGGPPSNDLFLLLDPMLRPGTRAAVDQAFAGARRVDSPPLRTRRGAEDVTVVVAVEPMSARNGRPHALVTFRDREVVAPLEGNDAGGAEGADLVRHLEYELKTTRETLESTIEQLETSNEQLTTSNEEVVSMNEELQSSNEEMEASKEELQSLNEELVSVNAQLRDKLGELEKANDDMANLLASADPSILFLDRAGRVKRATQSAAELLGKDAAVPGTGAAGLVRRLGDGHLARDMAAVQEGRAVADRELTGVDGRHLLRRLRPYRRASQQVDGVVLSYVDVTALKRGQRRLAASEQRYRQLVENMQEGVWMVDEHGATTFVNPQMAAMLGYSREVLAEQDMARHIWREDLEAARELWRPDGEWDGPREVEVRLRHSAGHAIWCLARSNRVEDGELRGLFITFSNVSGLKAAEGKLQRLALGLEERVRERTRDLERERLFSETILDNQPAPVMVLDRKGRLLRFNKACEAAAGRDFANLRGTRHWLDSVPPEERDAVEAMERDLADATTPLRHENHWVHADGTKRLFSWTNHVVRNAAGEVEYVVGNAVDITEERRIAERARQNLDEMARLQRFQTVNTLSAMLAHELNQPLSVIAMSADSCQALLERDRLDREALTRGLEQIADQAVRGGDIIRRLRRFVARGEVQPVPLDLEEVIRHTVDLIMPRVNAATIRLDTELADGLPRVAAVDVHIQQVLFNLVNNAVEAISQAGIRDGEILVRLRRHDGKARVEVVDNGPGFAAGMPEQPFQPLFTTKQEGLGVGLQVSRDLIRAQGGRLWAESPERGAAFIFELPFLT